MSGRAFVVGDVSPAPTDDEVVAIVAALEWTWPRPVVLVDESPVPAGADELVA